MSVEVDFDFNPHSVTDLDLYFQSVLSGWEDRS